MRFTKYHAETAVRGIMADLPSVDGKDAKAQLQRELVLAMSQPARILYARAPEALKTYSLYSDTCRERWDLIVGDADTDAVITPFKEKEAERRQFERKLFRELSSCTTLKQALTRYPEFAKYFPVEAKDGANVPSVAANVVAELLKMGWKTGAKQ